MLNQQDGRGTDGARGKGDLSEEGERRDKGMAREREEREEERQRSWSGGIGVRREREGEGPAGSKESDGQSDSVARRREENISCG